MALLVFEHSPLAGSLRLGTTLRDHGHRLRTIRVHAGDAMPADLDDVDGVIVMGGGQNVHDRPEWLDPESALICAAHERDMPVLGICLGCQIVAHALGGTTGPMDGGIALGFHAVELNAMGREDPLFTGIPWSTKQVQWHRDEVKELPAGAKPLASSERCNVEAWSMGLRTYGLQYHPEVFPSTIESWIEDEPVALDEAGTTPAALRASIESSYEDMARHAERLFESVALFLMPVDRRYQGQIKDLHH